MYSLIKQKYNTTPLLFLRGSKSYSGINEQNNPLVLLNTLLWDSFQYINNEFIEISPPTMYYFKKDVVVSLDFYVDVSSNKSNKIMLGLTHINYPKIVFGGNKLQTTISNANSFYPLQTNNRIFTVPANYTFCISTVSGGTLSVGNYSYNYLSIYLLQ